MENVAAVISTTWWCGERGASGIRIVFVGPQASQKANEWITKQPKEPNVSYDVDEDFELVLL